MDVPKANGAPGHWLRMNMYMLCCALSLSRVQLSVTPWTVPRQAPLSLGFSRQEYWSGLPCPPPGDLPDPWMELQVSYVFQRHLRSPYIGSDGKEFTCDVGDQAWSLGGENPLEKRMATHCSILAWRIPWTEECDGLQFMGQNESDMTEHTYTHPCVCACV